MSGAFLATVAVVLVGCTDTSDLEERLTALEGRNEQLQEQNDELVRENTDLVTRAEAVEGTSASNVASLDKRLAEVAQRITWIETTPGIVGPKGSGGGKGAVGPAGPAGSQGETGTITNANDFVENSGFVQSRVNVDSLDSCLTALANSMQATDSSLRSLDSALSYGGFWNPPFLP
jgi:hypothetical protein